MDVKIKYYLCEDRIVVRVIEKDHDQTLEYYRPQVEGWIPNKAWYIYMFDNKKVKYRQITEEEANKYIERSVKYFKRGAIYIRRIYGLDLEYFDPKTAEWRDVLNNDWYENMEEFKPVTKDEVENYIDNLFIEKESKLV